MTLTTENILLIGSLLLFISLLVGKSTSRFGIPILLFFIMVGMMAGSEGIGHIYFDSPELLQFIGVVALNFILFSGGIETKWESLKPVIYKGALLSTLGVLISAFSIGLFVSYVTNFSLLEGLLLGAIVSSTDAAAVFSVLRAKNVGLKGQIRPILEAESGSNDPMAYFLTIGFISLLQHPKEPWYMLIPQFFMQLTIGALVGLIMGRFSGWLMKRMKLDVNSFYPLLLLALVFITYSVSDDVYGNGFLAVYICGVIVGNTVFPNRIGMIKFFDVIAWLMQIVLFLTLGLQVYPSKLQPIAGIGLLISAFLIFIARPLSVFISLIFFKMRTRSKLFISWVGLRGAVPIVFATYPVMAGISKSNEIFNVVFFISITSVLVQGTTLPYVARLLKVAIPAKAKRKSLLDRELSGIQDKTIYEYVLNEENPYIGKAVMDMQIPFGISVLLMKREGGYSTPNNDTRLQKDDVLIFAAEDEATMQSALKKISGVKY